MSSNHRALCNALAASALFCVSSAALALQAGDIVDNFRLTDHKGKTHEFYYLSDMKAVVLMTQGNSCAASTAAAKKLEDLREKYGSQDVAFLLLNPNLTDSREAIVSTTARAGISAPVLIDETQLISEALGVTRNGEALVVNPRGWKIA